MAKVSFATVVQGYVDTFDEEAYKVALALALDVPIYSIKLAVYAASVRVEVEITTPIVSELEAANSTSAITARLSEFAEHPDRMDAALGGQFAVESVGQANVTTVSAAVPPPPQVAAPFVARSTQPTVDNGWSSGVAAGVICGALVGLLAVAVAVHFCGKRVIAQRKIKLLTMDQATTGVSDDTPPSPAREHWARARDSISNIRVVEKTQATTHL